MEQPKYHIEYMNNEIATFDYPYVVVGYDRVLSQCSTSQEAEQLIKKLEKEDRTI